MGGVTSGTSFTLVTCAAGAGQVTDSREGWKAPDLLAIMQPDYSTSSNCIFMCFVLCALCFVLCNRPGWVAKACSRPTGQCTR